MAQKPRILSQSQSQSLPRTRSAPQSSVKAEPPRAHQTEAPIAPRLVPPSAPTQSQIHTEETQDGYSYRFNEGDQIQGEPLRPSANLLGHGLRPKLIMPAHLECQLPQEVTDSYGFDRSLCTVARAPTLPAPADSLRIQGRLRVSHAAAGIKTGPVLDPNQKIGSESRVDASVTARNDGTGVTLSSGIGSGSPTERNNLLARAGVEVFGHPSGSNQKAVIGYADFGNAPNQGIKSQFTAGVGYQVGIGEGYWMPTREGSLDPGAGFSATATARVQVSHRTYSDWISTSPDRAALDVMNLKVVGQYCFLMNDSQRLRLCPQGSAHVALRVGGAQGSAGSLSGGLRMAYVPSQGGATRSERAYKPYAEVGVSVGADLQSNDEGPRVNSRSVTAFAGGAF